MNFEDFISSTNDPRPRKIVVYGTEGIGKTTLAAANPFGATIFLPCEDGYQDIRPAVHKMTAKGSRIIKSDGELFNYIDMLIRSDHGFGTVVLDSAESAELLIQQSVAEHAGKDSISEIGFGKGHDKAAGRFYQMLQGFDALLEKGLSVIIIAHAEVERFNNPNGEPYDRYTPRLDKRTSPLLREWADEVFFVNYRVYTSVSDEGFGKKSVKASGAGERIVYTTERPTHDAKNRLNLPDEIQLGRDPNTFWNVYQTHVKGV